MLTRAEAAIKHVFWPAIPRERSGIKFHPLHWFLGVMMRSLSLIGTHLQQQENTISLPFRPPWETYENILVSLGEPPKKDQTNIEIKEVWEFRCGRWIRFTRTATTGWKGGQLGIVQNLMIMINNIWTK